MKDIKFPNNFSLEDFVDIYVQTAFDILSHGKIAFSDFQEELFNTVAQKLNLSKESVCHLYKPFHWTFFNNENHPLKYLQPERREESVMVDLEELSVEQDREFYKKLILDKYREVLESNVKSSASN